VTARGPIWVFAGPSLPPSARPDSDVFAWRPPAMAGDGLAALAASARAVVLIDGLFDRYPAIRHKELLALIDSGVPVIGGASMGALRAAELHTCGMIGVGRIFHAYAAGRLVGDDEVAVLHGPADMDWAPLTTPLVNVRATLVVAVRRHVIPAASARALLEAASRIFFKDRTWPAVIEAAVAAVAANELDSFLAWTAAGNVDLKRRDALECLAVAAALEPAPGRSEPPQASSYFTDALARQVATGLKPQLASS